MIKLLILAYDFPPYVSVGGLRPYSWYKYLHQFDVHPVVITRQWSNRYGNHLDYIAPSESPDTMVEESETGTLIRTPYVPNLANRLFLRYGDSKYKFLRKGISAFYEFGQFLLPIGPKVNLYFAADQFLKDNKVDCIIATGDPFILFKYTSKLSRKYATPWIADYRDPWVQDKLMERRIYKSWCAFFERKYLGNVCKVTTVSTFFQKKIEENVDDKDFEIVYNGYDPEVAEVTKDVAQCSGALSIALAGTIYDYHPLESFLRTCCELMAENTGFKVEVHFYGINNEDQIKEMLHHSYRPLEEHVHFYSRMDNLKLVKSMAKQNVCLLFNYYSNLGTKIFDYIAINRKIILCYENDEEANELKEKYYPVREIETESKSLQADMIRATNSGFVIRDAAQLKAALLALNDEMRENGFIACSSAGIEEYSRAKQAERLAEIVRNLQCR